jgi:hypothetical protein
MKIWQGMVLSVVLPLMMANTCQKRKDAVYLGGTPVYQLSAETREVAPTPAAIKEYETKFNYYSQYNVPLHRVVMGKGQTVYLGLIVPPFPPTLSYFLASDSVWTQLESKKVGEGGMAFMKYALGGYNVRYVFASKKTAQTHAINLFTADSATARSYYDAEKPYKGALLL